VADPLQKYNQNPPITDVSIDSLIINPTALQFSGRIDQINQKITQQLT
jgi:hypothetical protein